MQCVFYAVMLQCLLLQPAYSLLSDIGVEENALFAFHYGTYVAKYVVYTAAVWNVSMIFGQFSYYLNSYFYSSCTPPVIKKVQSNSQLSDFLSLNTCYSTQKLSLIFIEELAKLIYV